MRSSYIAVGSLHMTSSFNIDSFWTDRSTCQALEHTARGRPEAQFSIKGRGSLGLR